MTRTKQIILLLAALSHSIITVAQEISPDQNGLAGRLHNLSDRSAVELAYIQTSKDIYETGEDLWFKVYFLESRFLIPSALSKTMYLQMIEENTGKIVWQDKYPVKDGFSAGHIYIDPSLANGYYLIAAFSGNSLTAGKGEYKSVKRIRITRDINENPPPEEALPQVKQGKSSEKEKMADNTGPVIINFFPEGGGLVNGLPCRVAFKITGKKNIPLDASGTVFEDSAPIIEIATSHLGMGSFIINPLKGKKYTVRLSEPETEASFSLPEPVSEGISMIVTNRDSENLYLLISKSEGISEQEYFIRVQCRGIVYGLANGKLEKEVRVRLPLTGLPQGINEITLFNGQLLPVAERLIYVSQNQRLQISSSLTRNICTTREKNTLHIKVSDEKGVPVSANLGVTIYDRIYQNRLDSSTIFTHLFLGSQLRGPVFNPSYYFNNNEGVRADALDLLMLTQGWRKYVWNEFNLFDEKAEGPVIGDDIKGKLVVPGSLLKKRNQPQEEFFIMAFSPSVNEEKIVFIPSEEGAFSVTADMLELWAGDWVYLKPIGSRGAEQKITFTDPFDIINKVTSEKSLVYSTQEGQMKARELPPLLFDARVVKVPEVIVKTRYNVIRGKYLGMLDSLARIRTTDYVCRHNILNCINHPNEADNRKPVPGEVYLMRNHSGQLVSIVYKLPEYTEEELLKMHNMYRVKAYYGNRIFYQPDYEDGLIIDDEPDFRNTLLWNPEVICDENGEATLDFFTSDINTVFTIKIEGVSYEGLAGASWNNVTVRRPPAPGAADNIQKQH